VVVDNDLLTLKSRGLYGLATRPHFSILERWVFVLSRPGEDYRFGKSLIDQFLMLQIVIVMKRGLFAVKHVAKIPKFRHE
jgi:hypothetical protein